MHIYILSLSLLQKNHSELCDNSCHWKSHDEFSLAHLQEVHFKKLVGTDCEFQFIRSILTKATGIQKVTIGFDRTYWLKGSRHAFKLMPALDGVGRGLPAMTLSYYCTSGGVVATRDFRDCTTYTCGIKSLHIISVYRWLITWGLARIGDLLWPVTYIRSLALSNRLEIMLFLYFRFSHHINLSLSGCRKKSLIIYCKLIFAYTSWLRKIVLWNFRIKIKHLKNTKSIGKKHFFPKAMHVAAPRYDAAKARHACMLPRCCSTALPRHATAPPHANATDR